MSSFLYRHLRFFESRRDIASNRSAFIAKLETEPALSTLQYTNCYRVRADRLRDKLKCGYRESYAS